MTYNMGDYFNRAKRNLPRKIIDNKNRIIRILYSKPQNTGKKVFIVALVLGVIYWILAAEGITLGIILEPSELTKNQKYSLLYLLVIAIFIFLEWSWARQKTKKIVIIPFQNLTNEEKYEDITAGFSDFLVKEYNNADSLREIMDATWGREFSPPGLLSIFREEKIPRNLQSIPVGLKESRKSKIDFTIGEERIGPPIQTWEFKLGSISLPLGEFFYWTSKFLLRQERISGNIHKHGSVLSIYVRWEAKSSNSWLMKSNSLPKEAQDENLLFHELARRLAYKMVWKIKDTPREDPRSFQLWVSGLDHYWCYLNSRLMALHELDLAQEDLEKACELNPQFALAHQHLGLIYNEQGLVDYDTKKISAAIEHFKTTLDLYPANAQGHFNLALAYSSFGMLDILHKVEMFDNALKECKTAIQLNPDFIAAYNSMGDFYREAGDIQFTLAQWIPEESEISDIIEKTEQFYKNAIKTYTWIIKKYKIDLKKSQRNLHGRESLANEMKFNEKIKGTWIKLGKVHNQLGLFYDSKSNESEKIKQFLKAEGAFQKALQLDKKSSEARTQLSRTYANFGDFEKLLENNHKALEIDPENPEIKKDAAMFLLDFHWETLDSLWSPTLDIQEHEALQKGDEDLLDLEDEESLIAAIDTMRELMLIQPMNLETIRGLAMGYQLLGRFKFLTNKQVGNEFDIAIALQSKVLVQNPLDYLVFIELSNIYKDKQFAEGSNKFESTIATYTSIADIIYANSEDPEEVLNQLEMNLTSLEEEDTWVYEWIKGWLIIYSAINSWLPMDEIDDGLQCLTSINPSPYIQEDTSTENEVENILLVDKLPEATLIHHELGMAYLLTQKQNEGINELELAYRNPLGKSLEILKDLADVYYSRKSYDLAINILTKIIKQTENIPDKQAEALASRAQVYLVTKIYSNAMNDCQEAATLSPMYAFPHYILGQIHLERQEFNLAIECFHRVIDLKVSQLLAGSHHSIANAYSAKGMACDNTEKRIQYLEKSIDEYQKTIPFYDPSNLGDLTDKARVHANKAQVLAELGRFKEASIECYKSLTFEQDLPEPDWELHLKIAKIFTETKQFSEAEGEYEFAIELIKGQLGSAREREDESEIDFYTITLTDAYQEMTYDLYAEQGVDENHEKGLQLITEAITSLESVQDGTAMNYKKGRYLGTKAWLQYQLGKYDEAIVDLNIAMSLTLGTQEERYHLALAYEKKADSFKDDPEECEKWKKQSIIQWEHVRDLDEESNLGKIATEKVSQH